MIFNFSSIIVAFVIAIVLMYKTSLFFASIMFTWFIIHVGITFIFLRTGHLLWETHSEAVSTLSGKIIDSLTNIFSVHLFARGHYEANYLKSYQSDELKKHALPCGILKKCELFRSCSGWFDRRDDINFDLWLATWLGYAG